MRKVKSKGGVETSNGVKGGNPPVGLARGEGGASSSPNASA